MQLVHFETQVDERAFDSNLARAVQALLASLASTGKKAKRLIIDLVDD